MTHIRKQVWIFIILIALAAGSLIFFSQDKAEKTANQIQIGAQKITVEIADTPELRMQGLSLHKPLKDDEGMLFIFDEPSRYSFWMKDMLFAIDMVWIAPAGKRSDLGTSLRSDLEEADLKIVDITRDATPESFPMLFSPKAPAQYVLEVNSGLSDKNNWQIGDEVKFLK